MSKYVLKTLLALPLVLLPFSTARGAPFGETITVGASLPLTGSEAKAGARVREGYEYAFDEVARAGGLLVGGHRVPVILQVLDDGTSKETAAALAKTLVEHNGADFLLGSFSTPLIEAQAAVADKLKVPYVTSSGSASSIYQHGFRYVFSVSAPTEQLGATLMRWIDDEQRTGSLRSPLRIAVAVENTSHGKDYRSGIEDYATKTARNRSAFHVVFAESFEQKGKDWKPMLSRIKAANADVLLVDAHLEDYIEIQKQYAAMGLCHQVLSYGARGPEKEAIAALPPGAADYILSAVWWNSRLGGNPLSKAFTDGFREKHGGRAPEWGEALAYESARALFAAIEKAGTKDREAVREALGNLKMSSILPGGYLAFPEQYGHQAHYPFIVQQNMPDGSAPIIYPSIARARDGVAPNPACHPVVTTAKGP
jgi:branched-chain amino acid transport system substrate-binding protein